MNQSEVLAKPLRNNALLGAVSRLSRHFQTDNRRKRSVSVTFADGQSATANSVRELRYVPAVMAHCK